MLLTIDKLSINEMTQTLASQKAVSNKQIYYKCYFNQNPYIVIAEISSKFSNNYKKKVIFPQERFVFEAEEGATLKIRYPDGDTKLISETITYG